MPPERSKPRPSLNDVSRPIPKLQPDYRPDHELPAPKPTPLLAEHKEVVLPSTPEPTSDQDTIIPPQLDIPSDQGPKKRRSLRQWIIGSVIVVVLVIIAAATASYSWYQQQLTPVSTDTTKHIRVTIAPGTAPSAIADQLQTSGVIRSSLAFTLYARLSHAENNLKAGAYSLQPSLSTSAIINHLVTGKQDTFRVTFLPGDTLANDRKALISLGYSSTEVDTALSKTYDHPLFATKPVGTDLEGYLYGETIEFDSSATVESILTRFFDQYQDFIVTNNIVDGFKKQGLTLYQGITLASIVQREVAGDDQPQVARVFLNRLKAGMTLGSDVTYQYAAKKLGVAPDPTLDSLYNTRRYAGLPPGPIATPGNKALLAVANPATNDYLFFLSGDDNVTYFAKTDAEHQQNIALHCQKKCAIN